MDLNFLPLLFFITLAVCGVLYEIQLSKLRKKTVSLNKNLIEKSFKKHTIEGVFDPVSAISVRDQFNFGRQGAPVTLHRISRFKGVYFLFICTSGEDGYFTQISNDRVINALRSTPEILHKEFPNAK